MQKLTTVLTSLMSENRPCASQLKVTHRQRLNQGTSPKEIVACELGNGRKIRFFCKYTAEQTRNSHGHRGGIGHEAEVYRKLLGPMRFSTPSLWGCHNDESAGEVWLFLEYLDRSMRVTKSTEADAMVLAARWIGQFHAAVTARLADDVFTFLRPYDKAYYQGWVQRTLQYAGRNIAHYHWLTVLFEQFDKVVIALLSAPPTIIHGEYYARNILFRKGKILPVDWESAAIAPGEIDLASLTEGWPEEIARRYESEYRQKRWPNGPPHDFEGTLCAARIYLCLRWLGESPELTAADSLRFDRLHSACQQFGLIQGV